MKNKYIPLHCHSHYSLLDGLSQPKHIAKRIEELDLSGCALSDHGNCSGSIQFLKEMKKKGLQAIQGVELYVCPGKADVKEGRVKLSHLPLLAMGNSGWSELVNLVSTCSKPDNFYYKPRIGISELPNFNFKNLIAFSGHLGSHIANAIQDDNSLEDAKYLVGFFKEVFGEKNFYLEIQLMDSKYCKEQVHLAERIRSLAEQTNTKCIGTPDAHYCRHEDSYDQRIILCTNMKLTLGQASSPESPLRQFFVSDNFHIPSFMEMIQYGHTKEELDNTLEIAEKCGSYDNILSNPKLPEFECPTGFNPDSWLEHLCIHGLNQLRKITDYGQNYDDRYKRELDVLQGAHLSSYFLIIQDVIEFCNQKSWLVGPGRGSAAGSLVSYLTGITQVDPIKHGLIFERFYNAGRNTKNRISMPDIDIDIPGEHRDEIIEYVKKKYGSSNVAQMITFQSMKGRGAIKDVLRAYGGTSFSEMNRITEHIPDEARIAGDLQEMEDAGKPSSIILWALENNADKLKQWCYLDGDEFKGPLAKRFEQAIRLEGTKSAQSKHAAGVVIAPEELGKICPMVYDTKTKQQVIGWEMFDAEDAGLIKYDFLGLYALDKAMGVSKSLKTGYAR